MYLDTFSAGGNIAAAVRGFGVALTDHARLRCRERSGEGAEASVRRDLDTFSPAIACVADVAGYLGADGLWVPAGPGLVIGRLVPGARGTVFLGVTYVDAGRLGLAQRILVDLWRSFAVDWASGCLDPVVPGLAGWSRAESLLVLSRRATPAAVAPQVDAHAACDASFPAAGGRATAA